MREILATTVLKFEADAAVGVVVEVVFYPFLFGEGFLEPRWCLAV